MARRLFVPLLIAIISLVIAVPVLAAYYVDIDVTESNGTDYDMLPVVVTMDIDYLTEHGFISENGLDVRIKNSQGSDVPFMLAEDRVVFASDITGDMVSRFQLTTDNDLIDNFAVCTGDGGYITTTYDANLALGDDFEIEFDGWVDTAHSTFPQIEATATSTEDEEQTAHTIALPDGIEEGDLLILLFDCVDDDSGSPVITWPDGWTNLDVYQAGKCAAGAAYKVAAGTESGTVTVTTSASGWSAHSVLRISSYQGVPAIVAEATGVGTATPDSSSLNPASWGTPYSTLWISFFVPTTNSVIRTISAYPDSYDSSVYVASASNAYLGSAQREYIVDAEDPGAFTLSGTTNWAAWTVGIKGDIPYVWRPNNFLIYTDSGAINAKMEGYYYYYDESAFEDEWVAGYSIGLGTLSKESDHLYIYAYWHEGDGIARRTYVTDSVVDLTDIDTLYIDWENIGVGNAKCTFVASTVKMNNEDTFDARVQKTGAFARTTSEVDVSALSGNHYIRIHSYSGADGITSKINAYKVWGVMADNTITTPVLPAGKYIVTTWADGVDFGIDIGGTPKDSNSLLSILPRAVSDWVISMPYFDYYTHTTSGLLRINYEPDSIIVGTTLPNEENPGTYYGTITWGSNPAGISVSTSGLSTEEAYYIEDIDSGSRDIISPEPAQLISGVDLEKLESNPFHPLVEAIVSGSGGKLTESLVWIGGAWFIFIAALIGGFIGLKQNLVFTGAIGLGLSILFYVMGIFDYWVIIIFAFGAVAAVIHERMPTW